MQSYLSAFVKVIFILSLGSLAKDFSPRTVVEDVFERKTNIGLDLGELEGFTVAPSHKYPFIACKPLCKHRIDLLALRHRLPHFFFQQYFCNRR